MASLMGPLCNLLPPAHSDSRTTLHWVPCKALGDSGKGAAVSALQERERLSISKHDMEQGSCCLYSGLSRGTSVGCKGSSMEV